MFDTIFQSLYTKEALDEFLQKLNHVEQTMYQTKTKLSTLIESEFDYLQSQQILSSIKAQQLLLDTPTKFHEFVLAITKEAEKLPVISLALGVDPSRQLLEQLAQWVHLNISKKHIIALTVDKKLVGGATIGYNGKYKDNSLRKYIEEYFQKQQNSNV